MLVLNGSADTEVLVRTVEDFFAAMQSAAGSCQVQFFDGSGHGILNPEVDGGLHVEGMVLAIERFLRQTDCLPSIPHKG